MCESAKYSIASLISASSITASIGQTLPISRRLVCNLNMPGYLLVELNWQSLNGWQRALSAAPAESAARVAMAFASKTLNSSMEGQSARRYDLSASHCFALGRRNIAINGRTSCLRVITDILREFAHYRRPVMACRHQRGDKQFNDCADLIATFRSIFFCR